MDKLVILVLLALVIGALVGTLMYDEIIAWTTSVVQTPTLASASAVAAANASLDDDAYVPGDYMPELYGGVEEQGCVAGIILVLVAVLRWVRMRWYVAMYHGNKMWYVRIKGKCSICYHYAPTKDADGYSHLCDMCTDYAQDQRMQWQQWIDSTNDTVCDDVEVAELLMEYKREGI